MSLVGVIPAAGRGTRAYPYTQLIPKAMLDVCGRPVLHYTLSILRDQLSVREVVVILGPHGGAIREYLGDGSRYSLGVKYVQNDRVDLGLAHSVLLARELIKDAHYVTDLAEVMDVARQLREGITPGS